MTIELKMLAWTLVLAFAQILLFDVARTGQYGLKWNTGPRDESMPPLSARAERLSRAQANLFETLPLFAGFVLIAHVADIHTAKTALGAQIYFYARVLYVPLYAFGVRNIRSLAWIVSIVGLVMLALPVLTA
ncbi:MAPEG family protein [Phenylobacterium sp.]|uniref:MAPEG family protein n=1 Tax=Phenylobacterium sp. TaxID=1871053 RepID=UPI0035B301FA